MKTTLLRTFSSVLQEVMNLSSKAPTLLSRDYKDAPVVTQPSYGIDRAAFNQGKNALYKPSIDKEQQPTLTAKGPGAVAQPASFYPQMKAESQCYRQDGTSNALINGTNPGYQNGLVEPDYIVRRLTLTECARLQGFPDDWCDDLGTENPTEDEILFWTEVWETHRKIIGKSSRPKTRKQIIKWLNNPHSDSAEYKMWGNSNWGAWMAYAIVNTSATSSILNASPPATRGHYRRFRIRTRGTAGEDFYSDWTISSNTVRKNILPIPPTTFAANPPIYEANTINLSWSGTVPGTSAIKQYVIQQATSTDSVNWSAYEALTTIVSNNSSGNLQVNASQIAGRYTRYRISVTDALDAVSAFVVSNTVKKNSPPAAPVVDCPMSGNFTYNTIPRFMITTGIEPDGQPQIVEVRIDSGPWQNSVDNPERFSISGYLGNGVRTVYQAEPLSVGSHTVTFRCLDSDIESASTEVVRTFTILALPFEIITANVTHVKAAHIQTLRTAINRVRSYYNLSSMTWKEEIVVGKTTVKNWPFHIVEMRKAIDAIIMMINSFDFSQTFDIPPVTWLPIGTGRPKADVMQQIHDLIKIM